ncbi:MAG: DUF4062 domain-containing protein [Alphaproteobacteria bacterium]|nr:DUF4062 domain-containing protein [Alphaproteobacteria bacterium]
MPRPLTQYRVFIASPGGLEEERKCFRHVLETFTRRHSEPRGVVFQPVGWEDTLGGAGRPQELINKDLSECDYAVFMLHDRWGSPTGSGHSSGVEEEWTLSEDLYKANKIRNIAAFFKTVDARQMRDPGEQLKAVLAFKKRIETEKRYLFKQYDTISDFSGTIEEHLSRWLRDHEATPALLSTGVAVPASRAADAPSPSPPVAPPGFQYWITEARRLSEAADPDQYAVLFCSGKALDAAGNDLEWAQATNMSGVAQFHLGKLDAAFLAFSRIAERTSGSDAEAGRLWLATTLYNKGITFGALGRSEDEIATYDDLLARFGAATEPALREQVAMALRSKGVSLGTLGRSEDEIATYDDLLARFGEAAEPALRDQIAKALVNKGFRLGAVGRNDDAIASYDDLLARFGAATEPALREEVAKALYNKGVMLGALGRGEDAIAAYDDLLAKFDAATESALRELVAKALRNKGVTLGVLDRSEGAIAVYDDLLARFGAATEHALREQVAKALCNKGVMLGARL